MKAMPDGVPAKNRYEAETMVTHGSQLQCNWLENSTCEYRVHSTTGHDEHQYPENEKGKETSHLRGHGDETTQKEHVGFPHPRRLRRVHI